MPALKCPYMYAVGQKKNGETTEHKVLALPCKSWSCPTCASKKSERYGKVLNNLFSREQVWFYTFTFTHSQSPQEAWSNAAACWNRLNTFLHQKFGKYSYVRILESHVKSPYPHYHICINRYFPATSITAALKRSGFGWAGNCQRVSSNGLSGYLRKYLTKCWPRADAAELRKVLRLRVFSVSRDIKLNSNPTNDWHLVKADITTNQDSPSFYLDILFYEEKNNGPPPIGIISGTPFTYSAAGKNSFICSKEKFNIKFRTELTNSSTA